MKIGSKKSKGSPGKYLHRLGMFVHVCSPRRADAIWAEREGGSQSLHRPILQGLENNCCACAGSCKENKIATMPQRNLQKVSKHISKKRGAVGAMHENSRDAQRLRRAGARDERLIKHAANVDKGRRPYCMQFSRHPITSFLTSHSGSNSLLPRCCSNG
jgi:hypothetical protein